MPTPGSGRRPARGQAPVGIHVWTARWVQGRIVQKNRRRVRVRSCVRPCGAVSMTAAQMGSAREPSRLRRRNAPLDATGYLARRFDQSPSSAVALSPRTTNGSASRRLWPACAAGVAAAPAAMRWHADSPASSARPPGLRRAPAAGATVHCPGARSRPAGVAPGRVLPRGQPEPGGEVPPGVELRCPRTLWTVGRRRLAIDH
jgi:hypothetical protein